jgi:hypothetical protein
VLGQDGVTLEKAGLRVLSYVCDGRVGARPELIEAVRSGIDQGADIISCQGNGMDMGPFYLGAGDAGAPPVKQNFEAAILGAKAGKIPFVFSLGGRAGADAQLEIYLRVIDEVARDNGITIRAAVISGEVDKEYLKRKLESGVKMPRLFPTPRLSEFLTERDVDEAHAIQAQMGPEPIMHALQLFEEGKIDGVFTGRALDSGVQMAYPLLRGYPVAAAAHMAKIIECGTMCCEPSNPFSAVMAELKDGSITVWPTLPQYRCTVKSVAGHAVYERENPYEEKNPGGVLDVSEAGYDQVDDRTVSAHGATWQATPYTVKLEGVKSIGYETAFIAIANDPTLISEINAFVDRAVATTSKAVPEAGVASAGSFQIAAHVIGEGALPSGPSAMPIPPSEVAILVRAVAPTQEASTYIATTMRIRLQMGDFPGRTTTAGNLAFPLPKTFLDQGETHVFNVWHLLPLTDPSEPFGTQIVEFPRS